LRLTELHNREFLIARHLRRLKHTVSNQPQDRSDLLIRESANNGNGRRGLDEAWTAQGLASKAANWAFNLCDMRIPPTDARNKLVSDAHNHGRLSICDRLRCSDYAGDEDADDGEFGSHVEPRLAFEISGPASAAGAGPLQ